GIDSQDSLELWRENLTYIENNIDQFLIPISRLKNLQNERKSHNKRRRITKKTTQNVKRQSSHYTSDQCQSTSSRSSSELSSNRSSSLASLASVACSSFASSSSTVANILRKIKNNKDLLAMDKNCIIDLHAHSKYLKNEEVKSLKEYFSSLEMTVPSYISELLLKISNLYNNINGIDELFERLQELKSNYKLSIRDHESRKIYFIFTFVESMLIKYKMNFFSSQMNEAKWSVEFFGRVAELIVSDDKLRTDWNSHSLSSRERMIENNPSRLGKKPDLFIVNSSGYELFYLEIAGDLNNKKKSNHIGDYDKRLQVIEIPTVFDNHFARLRTFIECICVLSANIYKMETLLDENRKSSNSRSPQLAKKIGMKDSPIKKKKSNTSKTSKKK
ncbi:14595_t:CDS:2, partial [Dentiscutata heterogama]